MTCKDCIHYEPCLSGGVSMWNNIEQTKEDCCSHFKNKADVVEVVRCEKCKDFEPHGNGKAGICRNKKLKPCLRYATDFCSYGERRDT